MAKSPTDLFEIEAYGPDAYLVRFAVPGDPRAFARCRALVAHLEVQPPPDLLELTPGLNSLLLEFPAGRRPPAEPLVAALERLARGAKREPPPKQTIELPVIYDGPDLDRVASRAGLSVVQVIALHAAPLYRVRVLGFAPGFAYLGGLDPRLHTPRLDSPRLVVPAGSVAIGGESTGIYPSATAGGWNLIGRTDTPMLDLSLASPGDPQAFRLRPGDAVRFVPVEPKP